MNRFDWRNAMKKAVFATLLIASVPVFADVSVSTSGDVATATISLPSIASPQYSATVTITFDSVVNLTPDSLNLTAEIVDPSSFNLGAGVAIDPNFPVLISVEPPVALYRNSFEDGEVGDGNLDFLNTYLFEVHTADLACSSATSKYRLFKAPHGSTTFADITSDLFSGSVRARGRGGAFSQFIIVHDTRNFSLGLITLPIALVGKIAALTTRLLSSGSITGALLTSLTNLLVTVALDITTLNIGGAISALNQFITDIVAGAGTTIANEWTAGGSLSNDAGDLISLADSLLFTLDGLQAVPVCTAPPP